MKKRTLNTFLTHIRIKQIKIRGLDMSNLVEKAKTELELII
ncbi:hypothetical protein [Neobacillus drentensis]